MSAAARTDRAAIDLRRAVLPASILVTVVLGALAVQRVFDPFTQNLPLCPTYHLTGLHCPGCGASRAVHALLDGDLPLALQNNALVMTALPVVAAGFVLWTLRRVRGRRPTVDLPRAAVLGLLGLVLVFTVARNVPAFWFIAPTSLVGA